ncbi:hypothetical protein [Brooklawnia cerclae]|uniref:Uncharacterized protein n=1 Tax=Brooklawnia cerclae TaxID=349934 RepID=A0ABX0SFZ3_9ACTN|nr:hypothetical protein [Brooklawnia cerclae]NIH57303.1 hypothetical protein [Brooklawnia cerclae]
MSWDARLVLKGLESYVDDNGVGRDDVALIVGEVFPRDMLASPRETVARVSEAISELRKAGLLWRYQAGDDDLLFISFWEEVQRIDKASKGRLPRPDGTFDYGESEIRESVASPRETLAPGTGEQGNRGTEEQGKKTLAQPEVERLLDPGRFDDFWTAYPRKVGKQKARAKFAAATRRAPADAVIAGAQSLAADPNLPPEQYIPHPSTWLERNGWEDPPLPQRHDRPAQLVGGLDADGWAAMHANAVAHASERTPQ